MSKKSPLLPPHYLLASLLASLALSYLDPFDKIVQSPARYAGVGLIIFGFWVAASSSQMFKMHGTAVRPFETSSALVTKGWYRISRNPMYLSILLIQTGVSIMLGSALAFAPAPILGLLLYVRFIRAEEAMLLATFGNAYIDYCSRVRRWL